MQGNIIPPDPNIETNFNDFNDFETLYKDTKLYEDFPRLDNLNLDNFEYYSTDKFNECFDKPLTDDLKIAHFNIRGIQSNYRKFIEYLNVINLQFDIIMISEARIPESVIDIDMHNSFPIDGYTLFYTRSKIKAGGVMMYTKQSFNASCIQNLSQSNAYFDSLYIKINNGCRPLHIGTYYRHCIPYKTDTIVFLDYLETHLSDKQLVKSDVIIGGDFNICLMKSTSNKESLLYLNTLLSNNLEPHIFKPHIFKLINNYLLIK